MLDASMLANVCSVLFLLCRESNGGRGTLNDLATLGSSQDLSGFSPFAGSYLLMQNFFVWKYVSRGVEEVRVGSGERDG